MKQESIADAESDEYDGQKRIRTKIRKAFRHQTLQQRLKFQKHTQTNIQRVLKYIVSIPQTKWFGYQLKHER